MVLEAGSSKPRCWQEHVPLEGSRESLLHAFSFALALPAILGILWLADATRGCSLSQAFSLCIDAVQAQSYWVWATLPEYVLILTLFQLKRSYFQKR